MVSRRLILSSPPALPAGGEPLQRFRERLLAAIGKGDVAAFVLRSSGDGGEEPALRAAIAALCSPVQDKGVAFLVEGRADLAMELGCDGIQVPAERGTVKAVRRALGNDAIVGVLCEATSGDVRHAAMEAGEAGADYVAFPATDLETLVWWAELMEVPCVAWDADPADAEALVDTGAEFLALAPAIWEEPDPASAVAQVQAVIDA